MQSSAAKLNVSEIGGNGCCCFALASITYSWIQYTMLVQSRSMSAVFRRQLRQRSLATSALASSSSHPPTEFSVDHQHSQQSSSVAEDHDTFTHVETSNELTHRASSHIDSRLRRYTAFVRPWDQGNSLPQIYAIVRTLEREYGRVRNINVLRVRRFFFFPFSAFFFG